MNRLLALCPDEEELIRLMDPEGDEPPPADLSAHVEQCDLCRERLSQLETALRNVQGMFATVPHDKPAPAVEAMPTRIGKYFVLGALGQGGQGSIFRALHPNLGKEVVIKLSRQPLEIDPRKRDRMVEEARMLQELNHPNLGAGVLDLDVEPGPGGPRPFLVMEYIRGQSLNQSVRRQGQVAPAEIARLLIPLARGLAAAHRRGLRHLDVKPGNIVVDELGRPRLIDFGLANVTDAWEEAVDLVGGTLEYMAPEQVEGDRARVDNRTDIYGLGGVLYFLLAGQHPRVGADRDVLMDRAAKGDVDLAVLAAAPGPRTLKTICRRALAADPAQRYATADAIAEALESYLRQPRRRAIFAAAACLGLAALIAVWAFWPVPSDPAIPEGPHNIISAIERSKLLVELKEALPLAPGDLVHISCPIPRGMEVALYHLDSAGKLTTLTNFDIERGVGKFDQFTFPKKGNGPLKNGPTGMEFLLLVAGPNRQTLDEVKSLLTAERRWAMIPHNSAVRVDRDQVGLVIGPPYRDKDPQQENAIVELRQRLNNLRRNLRERVPFFAGIAYPFDGDCHIPDFLKSGR